MLTGSCLCGGVRYQINGPFGRMGHCHCSMCRKAHGAAFGTYVDVRRVDFQIVAGEDLIQVYPSSPGTERTFCRRCGATLQFIAASDMENLGVAAGTLDNDPGVRPGYHIWVGSKAPWYVITDVLPQYDQEPERSRPKR